MLKDTNSYKWLLEVRHCKIFAITRCWGFSSKCDSYYFAPFIWSIGIEYGYFLHVFFYFRFLQFCVKGALKEILSWGSIKMRMKQTNEGPGEPKLHEFSFWKLNQVPFYLFNAWLFLLILWSCIGEERHSPLAVDYGPHHSIHSYCSMGSLF